jgi:hypothetical protein
LLYINTIEKEDWYILGKKMISMSDPNLVLDARPWSITSIGSYYIQKYYLKE